jgi:hypothetical protein
MGTLADTAICNVTTIREAIKTARADVRNYLTGRARTLHAAAFDEGRIAGLRFALKILGVDWHSNGCPDCGAALPGDGSCCDACKWVRT